MLNATNGRRGTEGANRNRRKSNGGRYAVFSQSWSGGEFDLERVTASLRAAGGVSWYELRLGTGGDDL